MTRLGRWIDFDNDYKTMYPWFMESVWFVGVGVYICMHARCPYPLKHVVFIDGLSG